MSLNEKESKEKAEKSYEKIFLSSWDQERVDTLKVDKSLMGLVGKVGWIRW